MMLCLNINNNATITAENVDYCSITHDIINSQAIKLLRNCVLEDCGYIQKMHIQEINIKNRVYNYHFYLKVPNKRGF